MGEPRRWLAHASACGRLATGMADPRPIPKVDAQGKAVVDVYYSDYARSRKMVHDGTGTLT